MTDRRLLLVRHGVTAWNREGRFQGHLDPPLAEDGLAEAVLLATRLAGDAELRPTRVVSSTLARAIQTAEAIATAAAVEVRPDRRLIEIGQGEWEGRTHAELVVRDADLYTAWRSEPGIRQPPGGEPIESAVGRASAVLGDLERADGPWPVCVVTHGGTIRILARILLGASPSATWALDVDNASISVLRPAGEGWGIDRWNDTLHLLGRTATHVDELEGRPLAL